MSVLIKMEMPTSCCECAIKSWDGEDDVCPFSGIRALSIGRQDGCPLVPVPQHGRLIDADALLKGDGRYIISFGKEGIDVAEIERAPTIIPAEEG